ncbi:MAG: nucleotidyltransferase family protein [Actinomycetia bacterium]|nr:nucleotidyltransferase family protein [Actinomycetes bacterium]
MNIHDSAGRRIVRLEPQTDPPSDLADRLRRVLAGSPLVWEALTRLGVVEIPALWLGAGAICDTVWNHAFGYEPGHGIKDLDIVYFDATLTTDEETRLAAQVTDLVGGLGLWADVKNEGTVHTWYAARFGAGIAPYTSLEDAIATWPTTAAAVGVRLEGDRLDVIAPYGLGDLLAPIVRPNRIQVARRDYEAKAIRWRGEWPGLTILGWEDGIGEEGARLIRP